MVSSALWNVVLGIVGGIISSIIVSRVFLLQSEVQSYLDALETGLRKVNYLQGMVHILRLVLQHKYDAHEKKCSEMQKHGYKCEKEYYAAHRNVDWIDADELQKELIQKANDEAGKIFDELRNISIKGDDANEVMRTCVDYVTKIQSMQEVPFSLIDETTKLHDKAVAQFEEYRKESKNRLIKKLFSDRVMIALYILVAIIVIAAIFTKSIGV